MMFEREWEKQTESMKERLVCGMCTPRRVTVSAAYIHRLEKEKLILQQAAFTREAAEQKQLAANMEEQQRMAQASKWLASAGGVLKLPEIN